MTHHTDAERAEFEVWASSVGLPVDQAGCGLYAKAETQAAWMAWQWQAARRAPAAPAHGPTADDIKEPKNGTNWRVVWWNESCRMMLPADKALDSFQSYKNGTLQFTLKQRARDNGGAA